MVEEGSRRRPASRRGAFAVALGVSVLLTLVLGSAPAVAYTPHPPILIDGDGAFVPANGVTRGSGTPTDPFLIEGWEVLSDSGAAVTIANTAAHFVIRGVFVHASSPYHPWADGIVLRNIRNGAVDGSVVSENTQGIRVDASRGVAITRSDVVSNGGNRVLPGFDAGGGLRITGSDDVLVAENHVSANGLGSLREEAGIRVEQSTRVRLLRNSLEDNGVGIAVVSSYQVILANNSVARSAGNGVTIATSADVSMAGNALTSDGLFVVGTAREHFTTHTIGLDNLVNGKPLRVYTDCRDLDIDGVPTGQILVAYCQDVRIANLEIADTDVGILLAHVDRATIRDNQLTGTSEPQRRVHCYGLFASVSSAVSVTGNSFAAWAQSIYLENVSNAVVAANHLWNSPMGVSVFWSGQVAISGNEIGTDFVTVEGGGIHTFRSTNVTIDSNRITRAGESVYIQNTDGASVACNVLHGDPDRGEGFRLWVSTNISIYGNTVENESMGVRIFEWNTGVRVYHNNIVNSSHAQAQDGEANAWDAGYPVGGNFWSDYRGSDLFHGPRQDEPGPDGIGDTPYVIDSDSRDGYPLITPATCGPMPIADTGGARRLNDPRQAVASEGPAPVVRHFDPGSQVGVPAPMPPVERLGGPIRGACAPSPSTAAGVRRGPSLISVP